MLIGFSDGVFYRIIENQTDRLTKEYVDELLNAGAKGIELHMTKAIMSQSFDLIVPELYSKFETVTLHTPSLDYKDSKITHDYLSKISQLHKLINLKNIVIHPNMVSDWNVFKKYDLPWSIENMDPRKPGFTSVKAIKSLIDKTGMGFTFDIQHCFHNDTTMRLAQRFLDALEDKIVEYHISGYTPYIMHDAIYKTKQNQFLQYITKKDKPIIIESTFDSFDDASKEYKYITNNL